MSQFPREFLGTQSIDATRNRERDFVRTVYAWMFGGLLLTAFSSVWVLFSPAMQQIISSPLVFFGLIAGELGLVFWLSLRIQRMSPAAATSAFLVYSVLNGLTLSSVFFSYRLGTIAEAFVVAGGMFGAMSVYGLVTKKDLTSWGSFFFMGLIGIILAAVVNMFLHSPGLTFTISVVGVFVFVGLTAYDTQKIKAYARVGGGMETNLAVIGALALYLDFVNLFLMLLSLFGGRRD